MASLRVRKETGTLFIDFRFKGIRCREQTALISNAENRKRCKELIKMMEAKMMLGEFKYEEFFPGSPNIAKIQSAINAEANSFIPKGDVFPVFSEFSETWFLESEVQWRSSHTKNVRGIIDSSLNPAFGSKPIDQISKAEILQFRALLARKPERNCNGPMTANQADSFYGECSLRQSHFEHPSNEAYLIIYSTAAQQEGETTLLHPAKAYAEAKGNEPPNIPDPIAQHSAGGRLNLTLSSSSDYSLGEKIIKPFLGSKQPAQELTPVQVPQKVHQSPVEVLPETEAFYRHQIDQALAANDLDKALKLAEEARRVGAVEVRNYLLQKLQVR